MNKEFEDLLGQYWDLAHLEGKSGVSQGDKANEVLHALKKLAEQPAQTEVIAGRTVKVDWKAQALELRELVRLGGIKIAELEAKLAEQPAAQQEPVADKHQAFIDSLPLDMEDKMFEQIRHWARQSYARHQRSTKGQTITAADSYDSHIIWAALRWAKENAVTPPAQQPVAWMADVRKVRDALDPEDWCGDERMIDVLDRALAQKPCCLNMAAGTSCLADPRPNCPLLAAAPQPAQRKPLTPEWYAQWIRNNYQEYWNISALCDEMTKAAHNIKENT